MAEVTNSKKTLRWGIIGAGTIAKAALAPAIKKAGVLAAVASRDGERAKALQQELGAERSYGTYEDLLADPDIEAVYLGLPNGLHEEWTIAAARAGKHVLSDKSLTLSVESALSMRAECKKAGVLLMEGFMYRHHPQWRVVREWMREGRIGHLRAIQGTFVATLADKSNHRWSPTLGKGCLFDITCYPVNVARYLTGEEPTKVSAFADWEEVDVDCSTQVSLLFQSGVMATAIGSFSCHGRQRVHAFGTDGWIEIERPWGPGEEPAIIHLSTCDGIETVEVPGNDQFAEQIRHFTRCVEKGELNLPAEDGVQQMIVLEAAVKSAVEGTVISL